LSGTSEKGTKKIQLSTAEAVKEYEVCNMHDKILSKPSLLAADITAELVEVEPNKVLGNEAPTDKESVEASKGEIQPER
jgi:hypothetical protein